MATGKRAGRASSGTRAQGGAARAERAERSADSGAKRARPGAARRAATPRAPQVRNAAETRDRILRAAVKVFADRGFAGGRIDRISREARSNDRMIYYYFGSKENLFVEVLERTYRDMREAEESLALDLDDPVEALRTIVRFYLDHYLAHPEMITLLASENLDRGRRVSKSRRLREISSPAQGLVAEILARGIARGLFRAAVNPQQLYLACLALNYFYFANRYTLSAYLDTELMAPAALAGWRAWIEDMVLRSVLVDPDVLPARGRRGGR